MGGKANKKRRKQERLKQARRRQGFPSAASQQSVCPLYFHQPVGEFYRSWIDCGSLNKTMLWAEDVERRAHASNEPDVPDFAHRMPYFSAIYGRHVPVEAAYRLDQYINEGALPVQWAEGDPITKVPIADMAPPLTGASAVEDRLAVHELHARCLLIIADDGTIIPLVPDEAIPADEQVQFDLVSLVT